MNLKLLSTIAFLVVCNATYADTISGTIISKIYAQSRLESTAHLIKLEKDMGNSCSVNRLYIDMEDKELFSAALAFYTTGKAVSIYYVTNAEPKMAAGHIGGITCKVISIY
jgi:hypothetical protein